MSNFSVIIETEAIHPVRKKVPSFGWGKKYIARPGRKIFLRGQAF